ncbi:MAG TPA: hypothetical protein VK324_00115 [Tepidisphaeraceae bacterium]|nr:hypothetical protein [Tepidisphaeraceae bacterium]
MPDAPPAPAPIAAPPPAAERPVVDDAAAARERLRRLGEELSRTRDRRLMIEYLRLRRALR